MNLTRLKADAPAWTWTARHSGMGYRYIGRREPARVRIYAVGLADDDSATQWRVDDGERTQSYATWVMTTGRYE